MKHLSFLKIQNLLGQLNEIMPFQFWWCFTQNELAYVTLAANKRHSKQQSFYIIFVFQELYLTWVFGWYNHIHNQIPKYSLPDSQVFLSSQVHSFNESSLSLLLRLVSQKDFLYTSLDKLQHFIFIVLQVIFWFQGIHWAEIKRPR